MYIRMDYHIRKKHDAIYNNTHHFEEKVGCLEELTEDTFRLFGSFVVLVFIISISSSN